MLDSREIGHSDQLKLLPHRVWNELSEEAMEAGTVTTFAKTFGEARGWL